MQQTQSGAIRARMVSKVRAHYRSFDLERHDRVDLVVHDIGVVQMRRHDLAPR
ncbi:hypothetical protein [Rhizobium sp. A37_96]